MTARRARNTNRQGANFELQIMHHLKERGYDTLRSSGSRGKIDVVAVGDTHTLWIQAKISNPLLPPAERRAVRTLTARIGTDALPLVAYRDKGKVLFRLLTGDAAGAWAAYEPPMQWTCECARCGHGYHWHGGETGCWRHPDETKGPQCSCHRFVLPSEMEREK